MKSRTPVIHIVLFLLLLGVAVVLFWITQSLLRDRNFRLAEIDNLVENRARLDSANVLLSQIQADEAVWRGYLPSTEEDVAAFASSIERLTRVQTMDVTLDFDDFPAQVDIGGKFVTGLGLSITLEGSYQGLTNFFGELNKLSYFFKTDKITILKHETRNGIKATIRGSLIMSQI